MTAQMILEDLTRRGFTIMAHGDKVRISPREDLTEEIREMIRTHRQEILALLSHDPASPWPISLPGYGNKALGPLTHCLLCRTGTWVRYGFLPLCLTCARKAPAPPDPKTRLSSLLTTWFTMNKRAWSQDHIDMIKNMIMDIFREHPEATGWFKAWQEDRPKARLC